MSEIEVYNLLEDKVKNCKVNFNSIVFEGIEYKKNDAKNFKKVRKELEAANEILTIMQHLRTSENLKLVDIIYLVNEIKQY